MKNHHAGGKTPTFPEIATATFEGPEDTRVALGYTFNLAIGSKG